MHERLSKTVENVVQVANDIARSYDREYVGTEHVLLAIARQQGSPGANLLARRNITPARLRKEVDKLAARSMEETWVFGRLPGTPHFKNVIAQAIEEARAMGSDCVCTQHLLLPPPIVLPHPSGKAAQQQPCASPTSIASVEPVAT